MITFSLVPSMRSRVEDGTLYTGLIRLHVLHHAAEEPIFGMEVIEELSRHGYRLSAGTLYPVLHALERRGYLRSRQERAAGRVRRVYRITPAGRRTLAVARVRVRELFGELFARRSLHHGALRLAAAPPHQGTRAGLRGGRRRS
jgi:PadR family transcriptional regulator PadR